MGVIAKQTVKGSFWSYSGVIIGFVTTTYLYTEFLTPEIIGLFGVLLSYSVLIANFSALGMNGVTLRLFPYFRNLEKGHHGFFIFNVIIQLIGFLIFLSLFNFTKPYLIDTNIEKSALFATNINLIIPLTLLVLIYNLSESYARITHYDAVIGVFLQDFLQRILILVNTLFYIVGIFDLKFLIWGYVIAVSMKGVILTMNLFLKGKIFVLPNVSFFTRKMIKEIVSVAAFGILGGLGTMLVFNIDKIIINQLLDLSNTGVYTIAFYFGTLVVIPSRPLLKISGSLIAEAWKNNELDKIRNIYYKSCINQLIIGGFIFLGIWINIDSIIVILGPDYLESKWVIFFIGIGYLIDMSTGSNGQVIAYSKYYRISLLFLSILVVLVISLLYFLLPILGIVGAGIAVALAFFVNNLLRFLYLYIKFKLQPFNWKSLMVIMFYTTLYFVIYFIPDINFLINILVKSSLVTLISLLFFWLLPLSDEIANVKTLVVKKIRGK